MKVNKFDEYQKAKSRYTEIGLQLNSIIKDYYNYNYDFRITHIGGDEPIRFVYAISKSVEKDEDTNEYYYWIKYYRNGDNYDKITEEEFQDIMKFADNPELYKATTKFNI